MVVPLMLALGLMQAPAVPVAYFPLADAVAEPKLATGIEVIRVQAPTPVEPVGPVVAGVTPTVDPSSWAQRYIANTNRGAIYLGGSWDNYFMWVTQRAELQELYESYGYRTGQALWAEKARAEGRPAPVEYGLRGGPASSFSPSSSSSSSVSGSNFSGGMYVGSPSSGGGSGGGASSGGSGHPGGGKPSADLP